jgi:hypothetical protein
MRTTIWALGVLGIGVTVAVAQTPVAPGVKQRAATLLPPTSPTPADLPPIARAVADDLPPYQSTSPVASPRPGPGLWGNGIDPNVVPAGATAPATSSGAQGVVVPSVPNTEDQSGISRGLDKLKGAFGASSSAATEPKEQPNATSPYRGTTPSGAVVYAGPPAYRWYGWGSVTPGANPYAPTGQYPKASANWYSITGATPGAFPVPVSNPTRTPPGTEPPNYVNAQNVMPTSRNPVPVQATAAPPSLTRPLPTTAYAPDGAPMSQPLEARSSTQMYGAAPPMMPQLPQAAPLAPPPPLPTVPQMPSAPPPPSQLELSPKATPSAPTAPGSEAMLPPPSLLGSMPSTSALPPSQPAVVTPTQVQEVAGDPQAGRAPATLPEPLPTVVTGPAAPALLEPQTAVAPTVPNVHAPSMQSFAPAAAAPSPPPSGAPAALPPSVTDQQLKWQPTDETQLQGQWNSSGKPRSAAPAPRAPASPQAPAQPAPAPQPQSPTPAMPMPNWDPPAASDAARTQPIARGQVGDNAPDPVVSLIQRLCNGKAEGVDVRWTGSKRVSVCFECPSAEAAKKLVQEICARPEFVPYRIDFCVLVK